MGELIRSDGIIPGDRFYIDDEDLSCYISATTWLKQELPTPKELILWQAEKGKWFVNKTLFETSTYGTIVHDLCEIYLLKREINVGFVNDFIEAHIKKAGLSYKFQEWRYEVYNDLICFQHMCRQVNLEPLKTEERLRLRLDTFGGLAGTFDLFCELDYYKKRKLAILDFKTTRKGFWKSNEYQLHLYRHMFVNKYSMFTKGEILLFNWHPKDFRKEMPTYNLQSQASNDIEAELMLYIEIAKIKKPWVLNKRFKEFEKLSFDETSKWKTKLGYEIVGGKERITKKWLGNGKK